MENQSSWYQDQNVIQWIFIIVTLVIGLLSIFQEKVKRCFFQPELDFKFKLNSPHSRKTFLSTRMNHVDTYYYRFVIKNSGNAEMNNVEVMVEEVLKKDMTKYKRVDRFSALNLCWSHPYPGEKPEITKNKIQPKLFKYCDFGHVIKYDDFKKIYNYTPHKLIPSIPESEILFLLDTEVNPNTGGFIIEPGEYKFKILISANNLKVKSIAIEIRISDDWKEDGCIELISTTY